MARWDSVSSICACLARPISERAAEAVQSDLGSGGTELGDLGQSHVAQDAPLLDAGKDQLFPFVVQLFHALERREGRIAQGARGGPGWSRCGRPGLSRCWISGRSHPNGRRDSHPTDRPSKPRTRRLWLRPLAAALETVLRMGCDESVRSKSEAPQAPAGASHSSQRILKQSLRTTSESIGSFRKFPASANREFLPGAGTKMREPKNESNETTSVGPSARGRHPTGWSRACGAEADLLSS